METYLSTLNALEVKAEEIAGEWNGDLPGRQEERAEIALDIITKTKELKTLLVDLEGL